MATDLSVVEGNSLEVCVILLSGTLDREIVGRLQTVAGTATESTGIYTNLSLVSVYGRTIGSTLNPIHPI